MFFVEDDRVIPRDWLERILEIDDLDPTDRAAVERFLASNVEARRLLDRVRAIEANQGPRGEIPHLELHRLEWDSSSSRVDAEQSLRLLLDRVIGQPATGGRTRALARRRAGTWLDRWTRFFPPPILIPAAVGALAILFIRVGPPSAPKAPTIAGDMAPAPVDAGVQPAETDEAPAVGPPFGIRSFSIGSRSGLRGGGGEAAWRTGESFVLRAQIERDGSLALVHVDPNGSVELLYPANESQARQVFRAGAPIEFPPAGVEEEWAFEGSPGPESFLLAIGPPGAVDVRKVAEATHNVGRVGVDRDAVVAQAKRALETSVGPVRSLVVDHRAPERVDP